MSQTKIKLHHPTDRDWMNEVQDPNLEADYHRAINLINSMEEQVKRTLVDKHFARLGDILEGIYLLRKVLGIEGVKL